MRGDEFSHGLLDFCTKKSAIGCQQGNCDGLTVDCDQGRECRSRVARETVGTAAFRLASGNALRDLKRPRRRWPATTRPSPSGPTMPRRSSTAAWRFKTSSDPRRRWPATTRPSPSGPTMPRRSSTAALRFKTLSDPRRRWPATTRPSRIKPDYADALEQPGNALQDPGDPRRRWPATTRRSRIKPDYAEALSNRGSALQDLRRPRRRGQLRQGPRHRPDFAEALNNRGSALQDLRRPEEALANYDKALAIRPGYADALFNRGLSALLMGNDLGRMERFGYSLGCEKTRGHASWSPPIQTGRVKTFAENESLFTKNRALETSSDFHGV